MKNIKKIIALLLIFCFVFCMAGCKDEFDNFDPAGLRVVDCIRGTQYETNIDDEDMAKQLWEKFKSLDIDTETPSEMGTSYLYLCFYNEDQSTLGIFTIYDNGACCLGEDFETFYTVNDGMSAYMELCDIYTSYEAEEN
ncbi:MAG: hypothetical protein IJY79_09255 [Clostridia bacterium]|nr:hypothetical protein [Clostridia bacterium]